MGNANSDDKSSSGEYLKIDQVYFDPNTARHDSKSESDFKNVEHNNNKNGGKLNNNKDGGSKPKIVIRKEIARKIDDN